MVCYCQQQTCCVLSFFSVRNLAFLEEFDKDEEKAVDSMSALAWRNSGISYLRYSNICAVVVRRTLKEPFYSQAKERDVTNMKVQKWMGGKPIAKTSMKKQKKKNNTSIS